MTQDIDVGKLAEQINDKADRDLWNTVPNVWNNTLNTSQITNCITEIPQDIKLELVDGTLTLKAGSKVYVPNGVGVFDEVVIASDITTSNFYSGTTDVVVFVSSDRKLFLRDLSTCVSGSDYDHAKVYQVWYDTTNNKVKYSGSTGANWTEGYSLPIAIFHMTSGVFDRLDQVFNGFGYIGSTVFALPGVKGLIPNGRNTDGSLKNIEVVTSKVVTQTTTDTANLLLLISSNGGIFGSSIRQYNSEKNIMYNINTGAQEYIVFVGSFVRQSGVITSFTPKTAFHAVDRNDSSWLSGLGMPSNKNINLTLGASGSSYTAPANGYFVVVLNCGGKWANITTSTGLYNAYGNNTYANANFPVKKGDEIIITYESGVTKNIFKFVYAEGDK